MPECRDGGGRDEMHMENVECGVGIQIVYYIDEIMNGLQESWPACMTQSDHLYPLVIAIVEGAGNFFRKHRDRMSPLLESL